MSGHRRVKDIEYHGEEQDDYSDYDDAADEELSPEDQAKMRSGTVKVKEALAQNYQVSDQEIQDALWHYYYDIDKSVSYLKNLRSPAPSQPKKPKPESRFDKAAGVAATAIRGKKSKEPRTSFPLVTPTWQHPYPLTAGEFFADIPWLNVPLNRRGDILVEPMCWRGGLLGGSSTVGGKPSKLAALAAARKQKEGEKRAIVGISAGDKQDLTQPNNVAHLLDRLGTKGATGSQDTESHNAKAVSAGDAREGAKQRAYPIRRHKSPSPPPVPHAEALKSVSDDAQVTQANILLAQPSNFAKIMLGTPESVRTPDRSLAGSDARSLADSDERIGSETFLSTSPRLQYPTVYTTKYFYTPQPVETNAFSGPSPDDIVASAQAKGAKGNKTTPKQKQTNGEKMPNAAAREVSPTTVLEHPRAKSKNLDVVKEFEKSDEKSAVNFVVVGHVDHGKSTLMGRLLYDLKVIDQRSVDRLRREAENMGKSSFALAWIMDQTSEERERGVTVDIATNQFETDKTKFTILDAPGHKDFIPNMIAGASQADFAVLVVDASVNSFESGLRGQTKEHALLVRSMGVQRLIVPVNKMDTVNWSQDRFDEIKQQMSAFLTNANFQPENLAFVPCAGLTGANIVTRVREDVAQWYTGNSLVDELEAFKPAERALTRPFRLAISDIFSGGVQNPLSISGRIEQGSLQVGDSVLAMPAAEIAYVKAIEVNQEPRDWAVAGQIATLHLSDIDAMNLRQGDVLCSVKSPIKNVKSFTAKILAFEHVTPGWVDCHRGRLHEPARIEKPLAVLDKATGEVVRKKPRVIKPGEVARVRVVIEGEGKGVPLDVGGKVVLRSEGETLAAGVLETLE